MIVCDVKKRVRETVESTFIVIIECIFRLLLLAKIGGAELGELSLFKCLPSLSYSKVST